MGGCHPVSIITDHDLAMTGAIAKMMMMKHSEMDDTSMIISHVGVVVDTFMVINHVGVVEDTSMADANSRVAYEIYGDVVVFDTTYNTNRYGMVFAPLIGVNNHGQTIVYACAFLSDETTDSLVWLFEQFKKAMPGGAPKMIITDQDLAMTKAISEVFSDSFHRYISKRNSLFDFIISFNKALAHQKHEELRADHVEINEKPVFKLPLPIEKQMSEIYKRKIFYKFQVELWDNLLYVVNCVREDDSQSL
ncbi:hypothetical protein Ddye_000789 [Dipteronia dyeriana]|uniref:Protein FAR1-RELATED SEQUENCE n=1 Tax=Dipteronia dyeriana TaxID=168575 RepID=A0AAE0CSQ0_9ROSI|nr:hypothetical protein Ddye_000789 [Dipteronia dyeriana]